MYAQIPCSLELPPPAPTSPPPPFSHPLPAHRLGRKINARAAKSGQKKPSRKPNENVNANDISNSNNEA